MARKTKSSFKMKGWSAGEGTGSHSAFPFDPPSNQQVKETQYEMETGEDYQMNEDMSDLEETAMTDLDSSGETKQNIFRQIFKPKSEVIEIESLEDEQKRKAIDEGGMEGAGLDYEHGLTSGHRTATEYDEDGNPISFKSPEDREKYYEGLSELEKRKMNVYGDSATITESGEKIETPITDDMARTTHYKSGGGSGTGTYGEIGEDDVKKGGYFGSEGWVDAEEAEKIRTEHDVNLEKERIADEEAKLEKLIKDPMATGFTEDIETGSEIFGDQELDPEYADRDRRLVLDKSTGEIKEQVERTGKFNPVKLFSKYKDTGRKTVDEAYATAVDENQQIEEEKKQKKKNKKKKNKKDKPTREEKKANKQRKQAAIDAARKAGKDSYTFDGKTYTLGQYVKPK
jgi:hypothetical protein